MATLLFRKPAEVPPSLLSSESSAIIDVGSNSIRLVVYDGPARLPATIYNEKVMAGLGRGLGENGRLSRDSLATAGEALSRFGALVRAMGVARVRTVATAAVREAANGDALVEIAARCGLTVEILSGEDEAEAAGLGVISANPDAEGIVGDLGGGSLELVRVGGGQVHERLSLPLGVLRIAAIRAKGRGTLERHVARALAKAGWKGRGKGVPLYLVGGSWRSLARLDMHRTGWPLPVIHGYQLDPAAPTQLMRMLTGISRARLKAVPSLSSSRIPTLGDAAALLSVLRRQLGSSALVTSAFGLREGLLFAELDASTRAIDPLIAAARAEGAVQGRFPEHGDVLDRWIAPLFAGEGDARLRHAACLLADVGWRANPEYRCDRGLEIAMHGNWVNVDGRERALLGQAVFTALGGSGIPLSAAALASTAALARAHRWGLAIRFAQRFSAGLAGPLERSRLFFGEGTLALHLDTADEALVSDTVSRRHRQLAAAFERLAVITG